MSEDKNSGPHNDPIAESPNDGLAKALEVLVAHAPFRASAQLDKTSGFTAPGAGVCPSVGDWFSLAAGELSHDRQEELLAHAALCTGCLVRLRESQSAVSGEAAAEEIEGLNQFAATSTQWQRRLALELAQTGRKPLTRGKWISLAWIGGSLAAALVFAVFAGMWWRQQNSPEKLLAEAYTQARSFDLRVPGAAFAAMSPQQHVRGAGGDNEAVPLLAARAAIARHLQQTPTAPHWLQMEARAQILDEHYDQAIDTLDRLLAAGPVTASLLLDDATAYYLRGAVTGSENDRATALDNLRRADELAPGDPVVLFNEAIVMEDRGQVMNAAATWNRFLTIERDPKWREEGQRRLAALQEKLNRVKTHESRMEQHLATPEAMRALALNPATLAGIDEEFATSLLPRLLRAAFPLPATDRSRGSPCTQECAATRSLLDALATSLEHNHQDPWLRELLPADPAQIHPRFIEAAQSLSMAIDADAHSDYAAAEQSAARSEQLFRSLGNRAGEERAEIERVYAEQRSFTFARCQHDAESVLSQPDPYTWIRAEAASLAAGCDLSPGAASQNNPLSREAFRLAQTHHYLLLELRARNSMASWAVESGDNEDAWRLMLEAIRCFYAGDFPPFRVATFVAGLWMVEDHTPRVHLALLLSEEEVSLFELAGNKTFAAAARGQLIRAALRAGALQEAQVQMRIFQGELRSLPAQSLPKGYRAENELGLADVYLDRGDLGDATRELDAAQEHLAGVDNWLERANYAAEHGELELALGRPQDAESTLRNAILTEEQRSRDSGPSSVVSAQQDRTLYADLAAVWLAQNRRGIEILALWERYRMRILGERLPACGHDSLDCLTPEVERVLALDFARNAGRRLVGEIVLRDRTLLYRADAAGVSWASIPVDSADVLAAANTLEHVASTPTSSQASIDQASHRVGMLLLSHEGILSDPRRTLFFETDPLLGNLPWPAVDTAEGPLGLHFDLEELPCLLMAGDSRSPAPHTRSLIIGASVSAEGRQPLPEVLNEARIVAHDGVNPSLLVAAQATEPQVAAHLASAELIHFAGHAEQYEGETRLLLAPSGLAGDKPYLDGAFFRRDPPKAARLVVFSACATGKREESWDHGMGDIVDTLASLGVPEVVATRWQIDSASAVPMMDTFYRALSHGLSVPAALTAARQSLTRDARYRHPYYWAAYYASGMGTTDMREVFHGN